MPAGRLWESSRCLALGVQGLSAKQGNSSACRPTAVVTVTLWTPLDLSGVIAKARGLYTQFYIVCLERL